MKSKLVTIFSGCTTALGVVGILYNIFENGDLIYKALCGIVIFISFIILIKDFLRPSLILQCNKLGIIDIYYQKNSDKNEKYLKRQIMDAKRIDLFFTTGQGFFNAYQSVIVDAMKKNRTEIRTIVGKKDSLFLNGAGEIEKKYGKRDKKQDINTEIDNIKNFIFDFRTRAGGSGKIEIKHFETEFRTSMVLIESDKEKWGLITLTTPPLKAVDSVAFVIKDIKDGKTIYKQCEEHFNDVWKIL